MNAQPVIVEKTNTAANNAEKIIFSQMRSLPLGNWKLTVTEGDAWIFSDEQNVPLHPGDTMEVGNEDGSVAIRALYSHGFAKYTVERE